MGYCMSLHDIKFKIKQKNKAGALQAIKDLAKDVNEKGGGGSWNGEKCVKRFYSWVTTEEFTVAKTLEEALTVWRWEADTDDKGDITYLNFVGEKLGDDEILFDAIAPFVEKNSYIEMQGEDGNIWKWCFDGKTMREKTARIVYDA